MKCSFVVVLFGSGGSKSKNVFDILLVSVRWSYFNKSVKPGARVHILYVQKINQNGLKFGFKVDWWFIATLTWSLHPGYMKWVKQKAVNLAVKTLCTRDQLWVANTYGPPEVRAVLCSVALSHAGGENGWTSHSQNNWTSLISVLSLWRTPICSFYP